MALIQAVLGNEIVLEVELGRYHLGDHLRPSSNWTPLEGTVSTTDVLISDSTGLDGLMTYEEPYHGHAAESPIKLKRATREVAGGGQNGQSVF